MTWLLDYLIGIGEALCPPRRRWGRAKGAPVCAIALLAALAVVASVKW